MRVFFKSIKYKGDLGFMFAVFLSLLYKISKGYFLSDKNYINSRFLYAHGYPMDWENPTTLNQKLQILKSVYNEDLHQRVSDKFAVRSYLEQRFGLKHLIPLVFSTTNYRDIRPDNLPDFPVIIKANHDAGNYRIIRRKADVNWHKLRVDCRWWLNWNYYKADRELQYAKIERRIIVEKLLLKKDGKIPNDYKLNYINGNLEFVYVSVDREGGNYRNIYDSEWNPLKFKWANRAKLPKTRRGPEIEPPVTWPKMKALGQEIARSFPYVRVDFYDVDGILFFGEITLCHGGGFDRFEPQNYDEFFGSKLKTNQ